MVIEPVGKTASSRIAAAAVTLLAAMLLIAGPALAQSDNQSQTPAQDKPAAQEQSKGQDQSKSEEKPAAQNGSDATKTSGDEPNEPGTVKIKINVTGSNDKPVPNASIYVRFNETGGFMRKDKLAEMNFKTNGDGSVKVPGVPKGQILIQVVAKGWHTYGKWYDVDKDDMTVSIKLEPPPHWY
jgi:hypothetical protein